MKKFYVLSVLEDGSLRDAHEIRSRLLKFFGSKCKIDTLRKNLLRLTRQGILKREKTRGIRRSYHYKISEKGRERLATLRVRRREGRDRGAESLSRYLSRHTRSSYDKDLHFAMAASVLTSASMRESSATRQIALSQAVSGKKRDTDVYAFIKMREEIDSASLHLEEARREKDKYKRLYEEKKAECQELRPNSDRRLKDSFELGRAFGKLESTIEHGRMVGKIFAPLLKERMERKQKEREYTEAILLAHYVNERWWDLLPRGYDS